MRSIESRMLAIVDERLFQAFSDAVAHFKSSDLILCFDESVENDPVSALPRNVWTASTDLPERIRAKLRKPAGEAAVHLGAGDVSFWLVFLGADGEAACSAVNAKLSAPGGTA